MATLVETCAGVVLDLFVNFHEGFQELTRRAAARFQAREWHEVQRDSVERIDLYRICVDAGAARLTEARYGPIERADWPRVKAAYSTLILNRVDCEIAETFFNSVSRRMFSAAGVDPAMTYVVSEVGDAPTTSSSDSYRSYVRKGHTAPLVRQMLNDLAFHVPFAAIERDVEAVAARIDARTPFTAAEVLRPLFFRNKGCYVVGRLRHEDTWIPLVLPLANDENGIAVDAVLMETDEVSIVFSFTRSYFFVETHRPSDLISFLRSIMPLKPLNELYNSLGFAGHGKTLLYRDLERHLAHSDDRFVIARGEKGMVMLVFTLPSFDVVFKVIRDTFSYPKTSTRTKVKEQYRLVTTHDRAGRLVDAQQFQGLRYPKSRFTPEVLDELAKEATFDTEIVGDEVIIKHVYTERRLVPLNIYLNEAPLPQAIDAVIDYGNAIKDLISANIFPGDLLLKNFGVTRHGRVVFYDYDELSLITECNFRAIPAAQSVQDELWSEPWYSVAENDIFPEELRYFLGLSGPLKEAYEKYHADLFDVEYWRDIQRRIQEGWIADIYPYKSIRRLSAT